MWQRSQTVYLALIVICLILTLVFPFAYYPLSDNLVSFNLFGVSENTLKVNTWFPYYITIALSIGLSLFSITQFKNRKRQLTLGKINYFVILLTITMLFIDVTGVADKLSLDSANIEYSIVGFMLPVISLAFQFLANRGIKKDEELIKSVDRLR
jgi:hypothetical protein